MGMMPMMSGLQLHTYKRDYNCEKPFDDMRGKKSEEDINKKLIEILKKYPACNCRYIQCLYMKSSVYG